MTIAAQDLRRALEDVLGSGGIPTWDRQGGLGFVGTFSDGFRSWNTVQGGGLNASFRLVSTPLLHRPFCGAIVTPGGGASAGILQRSFALPILSSPLALQYTFNFNGGVLINATTMLDWQLDIFDGTNQSTYIVRLIGGIPPGNLQLYNSVGAFVNITNTLTSLDFSNLAFHTGKMVINPQTSTYRRFILDNTTLTTTIQGAAALVVASANSPRVDISAKLTSSIALQVNFDLILLTYNEPS